MTWHTGLGPADDAARVAAAIRDGSWVDGTLAGAGGGLDLLGAAMDPLGSLAAWGASWLIEHVRPLREALDRLAGDPAAVAAHATSWRTVSGRAASAGARYADTLRNEAEGWRGASGDAYRQHADGQLAALRGISEAAGAIAHAVEGAGLLVGLVRGLVRDLLAQFVATLAARLPQWLAEEGLTFGLGTPAVVGQVSALVAKWARKIQVFLRGLLDSLRRLAPMLDELARILAGLRAKLLREAPGRVSPPRAGGGLPTGARLRDRYRGEDDPGNPQRAFYPDTVRYLTAAEREEYRLYVDTEGRLRSAADGSLFDTSAGVSAWSSGGRAIFVMDGDGNLYAGLDQRVGQFHHSSLLGGEPVAGAGEIEVRDGRLVTMTDHSGHYQPEAGMNDAVLRSLRDRGLVTGPGFRQLGWDDSER